MRSPERHVQRARRTRFAAAPLVVLAALLCALPLRLAAQGGTAPPVAVVPREMPKLPLPPNSAPRPSVQAPFPPAAPGGSPVAPPTATKKRAPRLVP